MKVSLILLAFVIVGFFGCDNQLPDVPVDQRVSGSVEVRRSFHRYVRFDMKEDSGFVELQTSIYGEQIGDREVIVRRFKRRLSAQDSQRLRVAVKKALDGALQPLGGILLDGSTWHVDFTSPREVKNAVRSPTYGGDQRGTSNLFKLGSLLWEFAGFDAKDELY